MGDWKDWTSPNSPWLREGHFISYARNNVRYYEHILLRDLAHYVYEWHEVIDPGEESGPVVPQDLIITRGYNGETTLNNIWQMIFGIRGQIYIYIELPTDTHRHGTAKVPKPRRGLWEVSHLEEWMSPFIEPSFMTEHFLMKPGYDRFNVSAYNPCDIDIRPYLNVFMAKLVTERVGTEQYGELSTPVIRNSQAQTDRLRERWSETLELLYKRQIPHRPLTLLPVRLPEAEE